MFLKIPVNLVVKSLIILRGLIYFKLQLKQTFRSGWCGNGFFWTLLKELKTKSILSSFWTEKVNVFRKLKPKASDFSILRFFSFFNEIRKFLVLWKMHDEHTRLVAWITQKLNKTIIQKSVSTCSGWVVRGSQSTPKVCIDQKGKFEFDGCSQWKMNDFHKNRYGDKNSYYKENRYCTLCLPPYWACFVMDDRGATARKHVFTPLFLNLKVKAVLNRTTLNIK